MLIEAAFASITFVDTQLRANGAGPYPARLLIIMDNGVGGVVTAVGADVDKGLVAKRVISSTSGSDGYAERAVGDAGGLVEVPEALDLDCAVALLADGRTAMMLVRATGLRGGERVLVEAAAGRLRPVIGQRFPLERAADAHAAVQPRATMGKTLLEVR